jgi:small-conductance mechanosensitive channel
MPIVRFTRVKTDGLDFELFVFVSRLEDRQVVTNDLNRALLARLLEEKIIDSHPAAEIKLRDLGMLAAALTKQDRTETPKDPGNADAPPSR